MIKILPQFLLYQQLLMEILICLPVERIKTLNLETLKNPMIKYLGQENNPLPLLKNSKETIM